MPINITDELHAATTKGKIASAKEVFLTGDKENLQQIGEKTHQLEDSIKNIAATGGASTAAAVTFDNAASGMSAVNAQGAIEELNTKNNAQDTEIAKKANSADINSKMNEESTRVDAEIAKKVDKTSIVQEFGDSEDKVVSQFALPFREIESPEFIHCIVDSDNHLLFGIQLDGSIEWGKGIPTPIKDKFQEIINQFQKDKTDLSETINTLNGILDKTTIKDDEGAVVETPFSYIQSEEFIFAKVDADNKLLFGIQWDGTPVFGKTSAVEDRLQAQVNLLAERITVILGDDDTTDAIDTLKELKDFFANIDNTQTLTSILANLNTTIDKIAIKDEAGEIQDTPFRIIENKEFFAVWIDEENHVLMGIKRDGQFVGEINAVNILKETVAAIQESIALLRGEIQGIDILSLYPPKNMVPILSNLNWHGHILGNEYTPSPLVLLWFSDLHQDATRLKRIMTFYTKYKEFFDGIIHTGDAVESSWEDGFDFWNECGAQEVLNLCGNHDTWTNGESGVKAWQGAGYSAKQGFERYIKPYLEMWKVTNNPENTMYWYKDFEDSKIRLIALDNYHNKEKVVLTNGAASDTYPNGDIPDKGEQFDWLKGVLVDAKTKGYSVICACHNPSNEYDRIECSFMTLDPQTAGGLPSEWIDAVEDFITDGGEFIVWLCGHNHQDWFCHIKDHPKQLLITVDTARGTRDNGKEWSNSTKPDNTVAEDCFNLISFEPYKGYIRIYRIGIDYDRHMRHIGQLVYDYRNQKLIWNS